MKGKNAKNRNGRGLIGNQRKEVGPVKRISYCQKEIKTNTDRQYTIQDHSRMLIRRKIHKKRRERMTTLPSPEEEV